MTSVSSQGRCPVCGRQGCRWADHSDAILYRCPACSHCFSEVRPDAKVVVYDQSYYSGDHQKWFENPDRELFDRVANALVAAGVRTVIDVGCGRGDFLRHLQGRLSAAQLTGIDLGGPPPISGVEMIAGDFMEALLDNRFDGVVSLHTIEHIPDIRAFAAKLRALCRPGGVVVLNTINDGSVVYRLARLLRRLGMAAPFERLYSIHHLHHFTIESFHRVLHEEGLEVIEDIRHNQPMSQVDLPPGSILKKALMSAGVRAAFVLGRLTGATQQQIAICRVIA